jgi:transposase
MRTLETKTITDKTCSEAIAHFGLSRKLENWKKPNKLYKNLQQLTRERDQLVNERSMIKNQIHAEESEGDPNSNSIKRFNDRIKFINRQEREIKEEITQITNSDKTLKQQIERMTTIPGIGELTAVTILAETNGFELIRNKKQLSSYAGFDIKEKQSGTSVKGKPRISKRGNRYLRKCMHLPSLSAVKKIDVYRDLYSRIVSKNGIKMKGLIAVQRKLLELTFIIFKNNTTFEQDYEIKKRVPL